MNIFLRELKVYRKGLLFWCLGMVMLVASGMAKYASFKGNSQAVVELMSQFPKSVQAIFGLTGFDLTKASGYFGVLYMYIALMVTVHAVLLGAGIVSKEERDKTSEFLFTKPISRFKILSEKILAGLFNILVLNLVTSLSSVYFIAYFASDESFMGDVMILMIGLLMLQLIFFFIGTAAAGFCRNPKLSGTIATSVLLLTFVMTFFINISENLNWLSYFTPFKYFDAKDLMDGGFKLIYLVVSAVLGIVSIFITYKFYNSRDLDV
ncbi:MAG: ABC transporter permease subunit [Ignavibacteria bacterium]|nr:ABC transporter permease subunit [Ignavibacteria bacterium]